LQHCVWGHESPRPYAEIAAELGLTEGAVKTSIHRLRQRCREVLRTEIAQTVARPEDVDEELHHLIEVFSE
jgi:RNA polymerase sigma-70 factor (ECF subfamily)